MQTRENLRIWGSDIDEGTIQQALKLSRSPAVTHPVALMPDAHVGIGATVGSVIVTENAIIPAAVGVDIGCGMIAFQTNLKSKHLPDSLQSFLPEVMNTVPAGVGKGHSEVSYDAANWLQRYHQDKTWQSLEAKQRQTAAIQLGTLGSGNHFFEVSIDENDFVWLVLHSGSRGVGNQLAMKHIKVARELSKAQAVEDPDLGFFIKGTDEFQDYISDMLWAQDYAWKNRTLMAENVWYAFRQFVGRSAKIVDTVHCHHNYAAEESVTAETGITTAWVTRKGAINAAAGTQGVIPGSMGTSTYIVEGLGNVLSYSSSSHGAGRKMSRGQAKKNITAEELSAMMTGRAWLSDKVDQLIDEAPSAYKDIGAVIADQSDLVVVRHRLDAVLNYKGTN